MEGVSLYTGSEEDVKGMYITPAINNKGWEHGPSYCMEYAFTEGRVYVAGNFSVHGKKKSADYYLYDGSKSRPLTIIEAKKASKDLAVGIQQAIDYAKILDLVASVKYTAEKFVASAKLSPSFKFGDEAKLTKLGFECEIYSEAIIENAKIGLKYSGADFVKAGDTIKKAGTISAYATISF